MTVLLDTNVVSESIRKAPDPAVEAWAANHAPQIRYRAPPVGHPPPDMRRAA